MASLKSGLHTRITCGSCGYISCICYKRRRGVGTQVEPDDYAPFGIYNNTTKTDSARGYGDLGGQFRDEIDGLQAGVSYLDSIERPKVDILHRYNNKISKRIEASKLYVHCDFEHEPAKPKLFDRSKNWNQMPIDIHLSEQWPDSLVDFEPQVIVPLKHEQLLKELLDYSSSNDLLEFPRPVVPPPIPPSEGPTSSAYSLEPLLGPECQYSEQSSVDTKANQNKNPKLPRATQWVTLQELRSLSKHQYLKFLNLTAKNTSPGMKKLRRLYGSSKGMLDMGIATFADSVDGKEPHSLKEVFAFTCLSYVMSKILQKHGRVGASKVLTDTGQWRLAIKREKDRFIYDEAVRTVWPEIEFFATYSKGEDGSPTSTTPGLQQPETAATDFNASSRISSSSYVPSSMLAYGINMSSDFNFIEKGRSTSCAFTVDAMQPCFGSQDKDPSLNDQNDHGFHDHVIKLLQETSTHEDFMFADFLNFGSLAWDGAIQLPDTISTTSLPDPPLQACQPIESLEAIDPKKLCNSYTQPQCGNIESLILSTTRLPLAVQDMSLPSEPVDLSSHPPLLEQLINTSMFQIVVQFVKFVTSLGELLYQLSGCGITTRRKKHKAQDHRPQICDIGEFINGASKLIFELIKNDLPEPDESVDMVLCAAETFVRYGYLQTVREIEDYIITTARNLVCNYRSFIALVSMTLRHCLSASDKMTWDQIYPSFLADNDDYSIQYTKKRRATEIEWALRNLNDLEPNSPAALPAEIIISSRKGSLSSNSSNSVSSPNKKRKLSPASESIATPLSSSRSEQSTAHCHYQNCKNFYTGRDARVNLRRHIRTMHEGREPIKCPKCGLESSRRDNVRKHFLSKHPEERLPEVLACKTRT